MTVKIYNSHTRHIAKSVSAARGKLRNSPINDRIARSVPLFKSPEDASRTKRKISPTTQHFHYR